jgi:hypothetical protein
MMPPLLLLFAIRVNPADPDLVAGLQGLIPANAGADAAPAPALLAPPPQAPAPRARRPRWADSARSLPPPISSLRRRQPALVRTRTADGRLVITEEHGEGSAGASGGRGGLICTRRRERDGQGHLTMSLI